MIQQTHVSPTNDSRDHVISLADPCWCGPQVQQETTECSTHIHRPILPLVRGHTLRIKKLLVTPGGVMELAR